MKSAFVAMLLPAAMWCAPAITKISPLGGQRGTTVRMEIVGSELSNVQGAEFDTKEIRWQRTVAASSKRVEGEIVIGAGVGLGPHLMKLLSLDGHSQSVLFYVGQFPAVRDAEPNNSVTQAQPITAIPVEIYGAIDAVEDSDYFAVEAKAGEELRFELRAYEYGSQLEAKLHLYDNTGHRIAFNDDASDFDDNPVVTKRFDTAGRYVVHVDIYRGPRAYGAAVNNSYVLRVSRLPILYHLSRLGAAPGSTVRLTVSGQGFEGASEVILTQARRAEHFRMTYPTTVPVTPEARTSRVLRGEILKRQADRLEAEFRVPADAPPGLWRLSVVGSAGIAEGGLFEVAAAIDLREPREIDARGAGEIAVDGILSAKRETDSYRLLAQAGRPLHIWTLSAQLGQPEFDTVVELRSADGKLVAESDDAVTGIASLGNADSSMFYTPAADGILVLTVRDRQNRGGEAYAYRLRIKPESPRFQLWTLPDNLTVTRGGDTELKVQMAREPGFENEEVSVWVEGLPGVAEPPRAQFRADQAWEPGADLLQQITPEITIPLRVPGNVPAGQYTIRVLGVAKRDQNEASPRIIEAHANLKRGPLNGLFNFTRRPLAAVTLSVVEPVTAEVKAGLTEVEISPGVPVLCKASLKHVPDGAPIELRGLPASIAWREIERTPGTVEFELVSSAAAAEKTISFTVEANVGGRWVASKEVQLKTVEHRVSGGER